LRNLKALGEKIDLFTNDRDHSAELRGVYQTAKDKLMPPAQATGKLAQFFPRARSKSILS
jgi:hypothetical protein